MIAKEILANKTAEWAIAHPNAGVRKADIDRKNVQRRHTFRVTLVNTDYYELNDWYGWQGDTTNFVKAQPSAKGGKGFLVVWTADDGTKQYRVSRASQFIATQAEMEALWTAEEARNKSAEAERARLATQREEALTFVRQQAADLPESVRRSVDSLLGANNYDTDRFRVSIDVGGDWEKDANGMPVNFVPKMSGYVMLEVEDFQRLMEKFYEAQEALL